MGTKVEVRFPFPDYDYQAKRIIPESEGGRTYKVGDVIELDDDIARLRIADGFAVETDSRKTPKES